MFSSQFSFLSSPSIDFLRGKKPQLTSHVPVYSGVTRKPCESENFKLRASGVVFLTRTSSCFVFLWDFGPLRQWSKFIRKSIGGAV